MDDETIIYGTPAPPVGGKEKRGKEREKEKKKVLGAARIIGTARQTWTLPSPHAAFIVSLGEQKQPMDACPSSHWSRRPTTRVLVFNA